MNLSKRKAVILVCAALTCIGIALVAIPQTRGVFTNTATGIRGGIELNEAAINPKYAKKEKELQAAGIPTKLSDIYSPQVPPAQNNIVLYTQLADDKANPTSRDELAAIKICSSTASAPSSDWTAARRFLVEQKAIVAIADLAVRRPYCVPNLPPPGADPAAIKLPEYAGIRRATRIVTVRSMILAQDGRTAEAVDEQSLGFEAAEHAKQDLGLMISSLVGLACEAITLSGMENILRLSHGDPLVADAVRDAIERNWHPTSPAAAISHEVAFGNSEIHYAAMNGPDVITSLGNSDDAHEPLPFVITSRWKSFIDLDGTFYLDQMEQAVAAAQLPYPKSTERLAIIESHLSTREPFKCLLASILETNNGPYFTKCVQIASKAAIARAACVVFVYKAKHHAYPSTLANATSTIVDPFDGNPIRYRRDAHGFVIYSIGPTGTYNGGAFDKTKQHEEVFRYSQ